jgi:hypothetical protein
VRKRALASRYGRICSGAMLGVVSHARSDRARAANGWGQGSSALVEAAALSLSTVGGSGTTVVVSLPHDARAPS